MFCTIRQYEACPDANELKRQLEGELLPAIRDMEGYQAYIAIDCGDGDVASISLFDTQENAEAANRQVAQLIEAKDMVELLPEEPVITIGEVMVQNRR